MAKTHRTERNGQREGPGSAGLQDGGGGDGGVRQEGRAGRTLSHRGRGQGRTQRRLQSAETVGRREKRACSGVRGQDGESMRWGLAHDPLSRAVWSYSRVRPCGSPGGGPRTHQDLRAQERRSWAGSPSSTVSRESIMGPVFSNVSSPITVSCKAFKM